MDLYKRILIGRVPEDGQSPQQNELKLSGLVHSKNGFLKVGNRIYKTAFNFRWAWGNRPKNYARVIAPVSVAFGLFFLFVIVYNFWVSSLSNQYAGEFYTNQSGAGRLEKLAKLFDLHGLWTSNDYDFRARELFYSLNWNDQTRLFKDPYISPTDQQELIPVVEGFYVTMAAVEGKQENSELLGIMRDFLKDVKTQESTNLQNEITLWLEASNAPNDQDALDKYDEVRSES